MARKGYVNRTNRRWYHLLLEWDMLVCLAGLIGIFGYLIARSTG